MLNVNHVFPLLRLGCTILNVHCAVTALRNYDYAAIHPAVAARVNPAKAANGRQRVSTSVERDLRSSL